jgi:hypothetical protein
MFRRPLTLKIELAYTEVNLTIVLKKKHRLEETSLVLEEVTYLRQSPLDQGRPTAILVSEEPLPF